MHGLWNFKKWKYLQWEKISYTNISAVISFPNWCGDSLPKPCKCVFRLSLFPHPTACTLNMWQSSCLSKANQGWMRAEGQIVGVGRKVLTEGFGQMDIQTGQALSALSDLTWRDRRMGWQEEIRCGKQSQRTDLSQSNTYTYARYFFYIFPSFAVSFHRPSSPTLIPSYPPFRISGLGGLGTTWSWKAALCNQSYETFVTLINWSSLIFFYRGNKEIVQSIWRQWKCQIMTVNT